MMQVSPPDFLVDEYMESKAALMSARELAMLRRCLNTALCAVDEPVQLEREITFEKKGDIVEAASKPRLGLSLCVQRVLSKYLDFIMLHPCVLLKSPFNR
jgi:hypothetical protein